MHRLARLIRLNLKSGSMHVGYSKNDYWHFMATLYKGANHRASSKPPNGGAATSRGRNATFWKSF
jgi:hypothetical protein